MGTATIRQGETKLEVFATLFDDLGAVFPYSDQTYRWGGSFQGAIDESELDGNTDAHTSGEVVMGSAQRRPDFVRLPAA